MQLKNLEVLHLKKSFVGHTEKKEYSHKVKNTIFQIIFLRSGDSQKAVLQEYIFFLDYEILTVPSLFEREEALHTQPDLSASRY